MVERSFGGPWTERKLKCLGDYLKAYRTIFTGNPKARYFRTWYVDAFAGTGSRSTATDDAPLLDIYDDKDANAEAQEYQDGSAKIALGLPSPFDNYLFIENRAFVLPNFKPSSNPNFHNYSSAARPNATEGGEGSRLL